METITLTGRSSKLSLIQIELVKAKIETAFPGIKVGFKPCGSLGDRLQDVPLQTMEGTDFFTEEVFENIHTGKADIAVHSLKDMSAAHFFGGNCFAAVDRDEVRDVAIFNPTVVEKLRLNLPITIGTCSPRRELMATGFLKEALPQLSTNTQIVTKFIRGNVDTRLQKLDAGEYDGIILAGAGLNRLLKHEQHASIIFSLISNKKIMVLPLFECTPAPCQGVIVAEALTQNKGALKVLHDIGNGELLNQCVQEKKIASAYGAGCDQKFGVVTIHYDNGKSVFASGEDGNGRVFEEWYNLPAPAVDRRNIWDGFNGKQAFRTEEIKLRQELHGPVVFVSNHKAVQKDFISKLNAKKVWAAGTKTWKKLAWQGVWVEGCSDGLGLAALQKVWESPLINIQKNEVTILTNETAAESWKTKNWNAIGTYRHNSSIETNNTIELADLVFWSSSFQFHKFKHMIKSTAFHACASGETSSQLRQAGIDPIIFPTLQAFQQWKIKATPSPIAG